MFRILQRTWRSRFGQVAILVAILALVVGGLAVRWHQNSEYPKRLFAEAELALANGNVSEVARLTELLQPFGDYAPHRHYLRGALLLRQGKFDEALAELQYSRFHPHLELTTLVLGGQALYQLDRAPEAAERWHRALSLDENAANAHRWLGVYYYDIGAMDNAKHHLETVASLDERDGRPHRLMGLIHRDYEMYPDAVRCYRESIRRNPKQPDALAILIELAECELKLHNYTGALEVLRDCPPNAKVKTLAAECHFSLGTIDLADRLTEEALREAPSDLDTLELRGRVLLQQGKPKLAAKAFEAVVRLDPKDYIARLQLAQTYQRLGRTDEARINSEVGTQLRDRWAAYANLHEEAIAHPDDAEVRYKMALMAMELNRPDLAEDWYHATLRLNPEHQLAQQGLLALRSAGARPPVN